MSTPDLHKLPGITLQGDEPVFSEPWEAQAFSMVIGLYEKGMFTWNEWADVLSTVIADDTARNGCKSYYELWLQALELITKQQSLLSEAEISKREKAWQAALEATPHGSPIELSNAN